jgi:YggT family protein
MHDLAMIFAAGLITNVLCDLLLVYMLCIFGVIILSWFPLAPGGAGYTVWRVLRQVTDPVMLPLRRLIPPIGGVFDLSPIIVIVIVQIVRSALCH